MADKRVAALGGFLLIDFVISLVMLATDNNLQNDFGGASRYYLHWYGVLAMGAVDLLLAIALLGVALMPNLGRWVAAARRGVVFAGFAWTVLAIVAMVGIVATWSQVGFPSATEFAKYLFSPTPYGHGVEPYIPWLYDLLLAAYLLTAIVGGWALRRPRPNLGVST